MKLWVSSISFFWLTVVQYYQNASYNSIWQLQNISCHYQDNKILVITKSCCLWCLPRPLELRLTSGGFIYLLVGFSWSFVYFWIVCSSNHGWKYKGSHLPCFLSLHFRISFIQLYILEIQQDHKLACKSGTKQHRDAQKICCSSLDTQLTDQITHEKRGKQPLPKRTWMRHSRRHIIEFWSLKVLWTECFVPQPCQNFMWKSRPLVWHIRRWSLWE